MTRAQVSNRDELELERRAQLYGEWVAPGRQDPEPEDIGRVVFNRRHRRTEANVVRAQEVFRRAYLERYGPRDSVAVTGTDRDLEVKQIGILYHLALRSRPEAAVAALEKVVQKACDKQIWHPVHVEELTDAQNTSDDEELCREV